MPIPHDHSDHPVNAVQCLTCNDVIRSRHRHDFQRCKCGNCIVDGGLDYSRKSIGVPQKILRTEHEWETALEEEASDE